MRLTQHTDYALRLLMLLALEPEGRHTIEAAARRYGISRHHLTKVAQTLVRAGFIRSLRGRSGGLRLAGPAAGMRLGDVVRATEDGFPLVECFNPARDTCLLTPACRLKAPLAEALAAFLAVLDGYTLADLVEGAEMRRDLQALLLGSGAAAD